MTPKENTSDLSVSLPLDAYSGAKYLRAYTQANGPSVIQAPFFFCMLRVAECTLDVAAAWCLPESSHDARGDVRVGVCGQLG